MSNHDGSYMLNEVPQLLDQYHFFESVGKEKTLSFIDEILKLARGHDCNNGEILDDIGLVRN